MPLKIKNTWIFNLSLSRTKAIYFCASLYKKVVMPKLITNVNAGFFIFLLLLIPTYLLQAQTTINSEAPERELFSSSLFIFVLCVIIAALLIFFFKNFTRLQLENFESYTTQSEIATKIRVLSILSLTLFPLTEYYESVYLKLYPPNWTIVALICLISVTTLLFSFSKKLSFSVLYAMPQVSYYFVYGLIVIKCLKAGMLPVMAIETACLVLFSKLIFTKLRAMLFFLGFVTTVNTILLNLFTIEQVNLDIYVSALAQASIVSVALFLVEGSTNKKIGFGSKVLESSNLFVLVADRNADFIYVNRHLEEVTGLQQNQILRDGWWKYLGNDEETTEELKKLITDTIKDNRNNNYESTIQDKEGNVIYVSWENTIIEEKYLLAVGKNVTLAKQLQIEEDRRKEKVNKYNLTTARLITFPYSENSNLNDVFENITKSAAIAMDIGRVSVWNFEGDKLICEKLFIRNESKFESGEILNDKDFPIYFSSITGARTVNAPDVYTHPETVEFIKEYFVLNQIMSLLDVPLFVNGRLAGVICCEETGRARVWDNEDINFARSVANFVALSVEAEKRKELEREYRYILNNAGDIIYTTDALGNFNFINKTASNILGYNTAALKGKHFTTIIHPDYAEKTALFYLRQFKKKIETTYLEFKVLNAEGMGFWVGQSVKLITERDNPEKVKGFQAVVRDINKQKHTELALTTSESNFRQLNENINETFYLYNFEKGSYDYMSPNCKTILGADQSFFYEKGDYVNEFVYVEDKAVVSKFNDLGLTDESAEVEFRVLAEGKLRWVKERSFPIKNEKGKVVKRSGVCSDITEKKYQEERLKLLSLVAQTVSNGVVITNANGLIEWCNDSMLNLLEYSLEELVGKRPIEIFSGPKTQIAAKNEIVETKLEKSNIELAQYTKSGKIKWLLISNTPLLDHNGKVEKYIEIITDVSERKALESEFSYILNNAGDIIYTTSENGIIEFLNESVLNILGYQSTELIGKHFTHIIHPEDKKRVALFYMKQSVQKKQSSYYEFRVLNKAGGENWVGQNVKLVEDISEPGKIKGFQAILRDITKQKEAERALIESENNFRQINEAINDVFYLYNLKEDKYDYVSPNAIQVLGVDAVYFYYVNNYINEYVIEKDRHILADAVAKANKGESYEVEYRIRIDQQIRWIKEKAFVIKSANWEPVKVSGICEDITQRKIQEKRLQKINKELSVYSEDLAINNLLKEQLIYTNDFEEIARVSLNTLKVKISGIARGSLFLLNQSNNAFDVFYVDNHEINKSTYDLSEIKSYPALLQGKKFIEHNVDLTQNLSKSDIQRRQENIQSYIMLPINYSKELIGALALEFETPFNLSQREMSILENFTSVLPVVVNKLNLQKELSTKSKDVLASLHYARNIQRSILPNLDHHKSTLNNFMSLYMPKDVVSGDFYLVESFDEYTLIALGDCTGHGVPGAFLTLLGSNFLQRIAIENKVTSPVQIF